MLKKTLCALALAGTALLAGGQAQAAVAEQYFTGSARSGNSAIAALTAERLAFAQAEQAGFSRERCVRVSGHTWRHALGGYASSQTVRCA